MYQLKEQIKTNIKSKIENTLGMTYEEYEQLDFDEQQKLIAQYHKKTNRKKSDKVTIMIGAGEQTIFTKIQKGETTIIGSGKHSCLVRAGITLEESSHELDDKIDDIIYNKPIAFAKKLQRRLKR